MHHRKWQTLRISPASPCPTPQRDTCSGFPARSCVSTPEVHCHLQPSSLLLGEADPGKSILSEVKSARRCLFGALCPLLRSSCRLVACLRAALNFTSFHPNLPRIHPVGQRTALRPKRRFAPSGHLHRVFSEYPVTISVTEQ